MDTSKATVTLLHDTRRYKKGQKFPVKLSVYFDGGKKRYKTAIDLTEEEWSKLYKNNRRDDALKLAKRKLEIALRKAEDIIRCLEVFSFQDFESLFFKEKQVRSSSSLKGLFEEYINDLEAKEQVGTAISYRTAMNSIGKFKTQLKIADVTTQFLYEYERYLLIELKSPSTISIYIRALRRIVNVAIAKGLLPQQKYPFKDYTIPASRNVKKALSQKDIQALLSYSTENLTNRKALDFWLFSYLSNGMNMTDICLLKPECLQGDFFSFIRAKTKTTKKKDLRPIKVPLTERSKEIIEKWRTKDRNNPYLFPILESGLTAYQIKYKIQDFIAFVNKQMKEVAKDLKLDAPIGTYVARHTHATILKRSGVPTELIKENLGHSSVLITENYLDDFSDEVKIEYAKLLTDFSDKL